MTKKENTEAYLSESGKDEITCLLCGQPLRAICSHLYWKHNGMKIAEYKKMFGLLQSAGILAEESRKLYSEHGRHRKDIGELQKKARDGMNRKTYGRMSAIDWDAFIEELSNNNLTINELHHSRGMPSRRVIQKKLNSDRGFKRKYEKVMLRRTLKYGIPEKIKTLRKKGLSYVEIAKVVGCSKSHVGNILKWLGIK